MFIVMLLIDWCYNDVCHPASSAMGTGSFLRIKPPERGVNHPPHPAPRLKKE
jgi:hypothetical protein